MARRRRRSPGGHDGRRGARLLVALLSLLDEIGDAFLQAFQVGEHQLGLDRLRVGDGVDLALDMRDVAVLETAQDVDDRVHLADVGEELVAEPLALGRAADEAGDVDEPELRLDHLGRARKLRQRAEPLIGDGDGSDVRLDRAEGIIRRLRRGGLGQGVEERRLADVGQADDAAAETHDAIRL